MERQELACHFMGLITALWAGKEYAGHDRDILALRGEPATDKSSTWAR